MSFLPAANAQNQAPSFTFRKRHARIDWRKLAAVDVDKVAREVDVGSLQDNLYNVAFCNIDGEEFQGMDPHFMKLFKLAQLTMEYLMYTQQYLNSQVTELQQKLKDVSEEMECCKKELATRNDDLKAVKKENRKRRKAIEAYQEMLSSGATGIHPCPVCKREFITGDFLQSHIDRRHPEHPSSKSRISEDYQARLLQQVTEKVRESERMFKEELSLRERRTKDEKEREFEEWKRMEKRYHEEEMDRARRPLLEQIEKLHQEKQQVEASVVEQKDLLATARLQLSSAREETAQVQEQAKVLSDRELSRKTQIDAEIESLKSSFAEQVGNLKQEQKKRSKSWKKDMEEMRSAYERQLHESQVKMHSLEQTLQSSWREGQREAELAMTNQVGDLQQKLNEQQRVIDQQSKHIEQLTLRSTSTTPVHVIQKPSPPPQDLPRQVCISSSEEEEETTASSSEDDTRRDFPDGKQPALLVQQLPPPQEPLSPQHVPFQKWPMIKTLYQQCPDELSNVHLKLSKFMQEALEQRGVLKDCSGMTDSEFEVKMRALTEQRPKWEESYVNFTQCRDRVKAEVENIVAANFSPSLGDKRKKSKKKKKESGHSVENELDQVHQLPPTSPQHTGTNVPYGKPPRSPTPTGDHSTVPLTAGVVIHQPLQPAHQPQHPVHLPQQPTHQPPQPTHQPSRQPSHQLPQPTHQPSHQPVHQPPQQPLHQPVSLSSAHRLAHSSTAAEPPHQTAPMTAVKPATMLYNYDTSSGEESDFVSSEEGEGDSPSPHTTQQHRPLTRVVGVVPQGDSPSPHSTQQHRPLTRVVGVVPQGQQQQQLVGHQDKHPLPKHQLQQHTQVTSTEKVTSVSSAVERVSRNNNSWDSSSDDEDQLPVQTITVTGRASSTPIKGTQPSKVHQLASNLAIGSDPSKRPPGGVPMFPTMESGISEIRPFGGSDSDDVFSDTESSLDVELAVKQGLAKGPPQRKEDSLATKTLSQRSSTRSPLPTVTPVTLEDLTDSDFAL